MARKTKPLTDTEIKAAKPNDADYQLYDGWPAPHQLPLPMPETIV